MQLIKCDFCGKDVSKTYFRLVPYKVSGVHVSEPYNYFELCEKCARDLEKRRFCYKQEGEQ